MCMLLKAAVRRLFQRERRKKQGVKHSKRDRDSQNASQPEPSAGGFMVLIYFRNSLLKSIPHVNHLPGWGYRLISKKRKVELLPGWTWVRK